MVTDWGGVVTVKGMDGGDARGKEVRRLSDFLATYIPPLVHPSSHSSSWPLPTSHSSSAMGRGLSASASHQSHFVDGDLLLACARMAPEEQSRVAEAANIGSKEALLLLLEHAGKA
mmetsp:Transcript_6990/g.16882  ORF Transcript_6990/g.16882 Transcript_6990/m.16882 type:complete len:116 (-) Transcript_6990:352-699(-)